MRSRLGVEMTCESSPVVWVQRRRLHDEPRDVHRTAAGFPRSPLEGLDTKLTP
ncbi:MAG: hypothetical protein R2712_14570 [Vicinamibacterales bacterium]